MRRIFSASLLLVALGVGAAETAEVVLDVPGMNCSLCPISVRKALERVPGVVEAKAELATKSARARFDPGKVSAEALARAVSQAGYPATVRPR